MGNFTQDNIQRKRKIKKKKRRVKIFRLFIFMCFMLVVMAALSWCAYLLGLWGYHVYSSYTSIRAGFEQERQAEGMTDIDTDGCTNVLIIGVDEGLSDTGQQTADSLFFVSFDSQSGKMRCISIPRGTVAAGPGNTQTKLGQLYVTGGKDAVIRGVSGLLGKDINHYLIVDMEGLKELIDVLGGIDIYVEEKMDYDDPEGKISIHLNKGYQRLDGAAAVKYLRYRGGDLGDVGRVQRQQHFMKVLYTKLLNVQSVSKIPLVADICKRRIKTSLKISDTDDLLLMIRKIKYEEPVTLMLPGAAPAADMTAWVPDKAKIEQKMQEMFP